MSIVLNELDWAERMVRDKALGKKPFETLTRVAKYYTYLKYSKKEIRRMLDEFLLQCEPTASLVSWSDILDNAAKSAAKYPLVMIDEIIITKPEMDRIDALDGRQVRRLAFTLLCVAKYLYAVSPSTSYWVNTPDNEIMTMANINTSIKRQSSMFGQLRDEGFIRFSKQIDNLSVQVLFCEPGDPALKVKDFRNLGYQYMKYHGDPYFECEHCGLTTKVKNPGVGRRPKYCPDCAIEVKVQQSVNSAMKNRVAQVNDKRFTLYMHSFPNGKKYVGITSVGLNSRWQNGAGYSDNEAMSKAINRFGWDKVDHCILMSGLDYQSARKYESIMIQKWDTASPTHGYNTVSGKYIHGNVADGTVDVPLLSPIRVNSQGLPIS